MNKYYVNMKKRIAEMPEEEREAYRVERNRKYREYIRRIKAEKSDAYMRLLERGARWRRKKVKKMTDEQRRRHREYQREYQRKYRMRMTDEERTASREYHREYNRRYYMSIPEEQRARYRERSRLRYYERKAELGIVTHRKGENRKTVPVVPFIPPDPCEKKKRIPIGFSENTKIKEFMDKIKNNINKDS